MTNNPKSGKHETRLPPPQLCQPIVTGRMKSIMVLKRIFDKNIVRSKITTVEQNCQNVPQAQFLSQTDRYRFHKYGIRYYILIFCVIFYALLGGIIFHATEHHDEIRHLEENVERLNLLIRGFTGHFVNITNGTLTRRRQNHVDNLIRDFYQQMFEIEEKYKQSILYKYNQMKNGTLTWTFSSAVFYATTLFTTIGYGTIVCRTTAGKILTVVYSIIGIPLMLAVLRDIGNIMLRFLTIVYNAYRQYVWKIRLRNRKVSDVENNNIEYEDAEFPLKLFIPITIIYLLICTTIVTALDANPDVPSRMTFGDAFYFCFTTMATIGLGDVMPSNLEHNPLITLMFPIGLTLLSVVNSNGYKQLEHCLINAVVNLELFVERLQHRSQDGHMIFQWLAPNIELLAITLPIFDNKTIFRDEVLQPTATAAADDYHLNNERNLMTHEATLGIFSSNNYEEDAQLNFDMMRLIEMKNNKTYDLNHVNRKNLIRRALTCGPSVQNLRRFRTLSEL